MARGLSVWKVSLGPAILAGIAVTVAVLLEDGAAGPWPSITLEATAVSVCFTPAESCEQRLLSVIDSAQSEILVQAYSFTSRPIAKALARAQRRGVSVAILVDREREGERYGALDELRSAGARVIADGCCDKAHNKVMILDAVAVFTGSYNWSASAEKRNAENLLLIRDRAIAARYRDNWLRHARNAGADMDWMP